MDNPITTEARTWIGTPFYPRMAKKGVGADCVQLALAIYKAAGALPESASLPKYRLGSGYHLSKSIVTDWLESSGFFTQVNSAQPGDLVSFHVGRVEHHVGIVIEDGRFIQAIKRYGVVESQLDQWMDALRSIWRLKNVR